MASPSVALPFAADSPYTQQEISAKDASLSDLGSLLKGVSNDMRAFNEAIRLSARAAVALAGKIREAKNIEVANGDSAVMPLLNWFADVLVEVASAQGTLGECLEASFVKPVEAFHADLAKLPDLKKKWLSTSSAHDTILGRYLRSPANFKVSDGAESPSMSSPNATTMPQRKGLRGMFGRGNNSSNPADSTSSSSGGNERNGAMALVTSVRETELARFELTRHLNEAEARATFELGDCIVASVHSFRACYHQQLDACESFEPFCDAFQGALPRLRASHQASKRQGEVHRQHLNEILYAPPPSEYGSISPKAAAGSTTEVPGGGSMDGWYRETVDKLAGLTPPRPASKGIVKEGWLFMRTAGRVQAVWLRRWFTLDGDSLAFLATKPGDGRGDSQSTSVAEMLLSTVRDVSPDDKTALPFAFEVFSAHRPSVLLQGVSAADRDSWTSALKACIQNRLASASTDLPTSPRSPVGARGDASPSKSAHLTPPALAAENSQTMTTSLEDNAAAAALDAVRRSPGNELCVDCSTPNPEWASINLGVVLCITCSGVHRSLGSHVSKVRSLTLDNVTPTTSRLLAAVGNARANAVWEQNVSPNDTKPHEGSPHSAKEAWIKAKYLDRRFLGAALTPELVDNALRLAVEHGDVSSVAAALAGGASPTAKAEALRLACSSPERGVGDATASCLCDLLVLNGADWRAADSESGLNALQLASAQGPFSEVARTASTWADGS